MKINTKTLVVLFLLVGFNVLKAQFSGLFAPANWTHTAYFNSNGIVNTSGAPASIVMVSSTNLTGPMQSENCYSITIPQAGFISFNWSYYNLLGNPYFDTPMYMVNGQGQSLNGIVYPTYGSQSGIQPCIPVNQGDNFCLRMTGDNNISPGTCTYSAFLFTPLSASVTPTNPIVCSGGTVALTANGIGTYSWSGGISNGVAFTPTATSVYTVSWGSTCIVTQTVLVTVVPSSTVSLTVTPTNTTICPGGTLALTATGGTVYNWSGGISNGVTFAPTASAIYTVSSGAGPCAATQTASVIYQAPVTISNPNSTICVNSSATLAANPNTTYSWSTGANTQNIVVTPAVTTTYTLFASTAAGCNNQAVSTVFVVNAVPSLIITNSNGTNGTCPNTPLSLNASGANTYAWTGGISNNVAFTPTTSGTYTVTGTNACGTSTAAASVSIHPIPLVTASVNNPTVCFGGSVILSGGGALSYVWTPSAPNNQPFSPPASANYTVRGTSALGCTATAVQGLTVFISPTVTPVSSQSAMCVGATTTLTASGAIGYTWVPGNFNTPGITVSPPISTTYTLYRTNGICSYTNTVNIIVSFPPVLNVSTGTNLVCSGSAASITVAGATNNVIYPGGIAGANFTVYPTASTIYTVVGSNPGCASTATIGISVTSNPAISISSSGYTICQGQSVTLNILGTGFVTYTWQPSGNSNAPAVISPSVTTNVTVTATNALGCTSVQQQLITVKPSPNLNILTNKPYLCVGDTAVLSIASPSGNIVYTWNNSVPGTSIVVSPSLTTTYSVAASNTLNGCQASNFITMPVYIATFVVTSPTAICSGATATVSAAGSALSYSWSANGGVPIAIGTPSVLVSPLTNSVYYVTGFNNGCATTQNFPILVNSSPTVTAIANKQICRFETSQIIATGASSYSWNTGANTPAIIVTLSVTTTYTVTGTDLNGCVNTVTVTQFVATCIGVEDFENNGIGGISVFPNPSNGHFTITSNEIISLTIVDVLGQVVSTLSLNEENPEGHRDEVMVNDLPTGIYFITAQKNGKRLNTKIVVER